MSVILLDRDIVHYEVLGRGRPLIFLHGWVGSWRYWLPVMQAASMSFRAYAIDFWGFGETAKKPIHYPIDQQIQLLDSFLEQMGIIKVALVGHGLGAIVAMQYAMNHPEFVDRVLAVSYPVEEAMINNRLKNTTPSGLAEWLVGRTTLTEPVRMDAPKTDPQAIQSSLASLTGLKETMLQLSTACVLVNGQNDPVMEAPRPEQLSSLPEFTHAVTFEQSGHFPMLDESSKFNRLVGDFLALASGESPRQLQLKEEWKRRVR